MTVGVVSQPGADAERYRCACLHCTQTQGLAGRGDGYQCGLDWRRSRSALKSRKSRVVLLTALQICPFPPYSLSLSFNFVKRLKVNVQVRLICIAPYYELLVSNSYRIHDTREQCRYSDHPSPTQAGH